MSTAGEFRRMGLEGNGVDLRTFKNDGAFHSQMPFLRKIVVPAEITDAAAVTFTAAQILGGYLVRDPAGGARADKVPTAASIVAAISDFQVGDSFEFVIENSADAAETITITTNTGITLSGTMTIAQNESKRFLAVCTSATAVTIYNMGVFTT